jgi:hypothetical protein
LSNLDFCLFHLSYSLSGPSPPSPLPSSVSRDHSTDSAVLIFSSLFFIAFCSHSSPVTIPVLPHLLLCFTHFSLSSAFLDSLVFLQFLCFFSPFCSPFFSLHSGSVYNL